MKTILSRLRLPRIGSARDERGQAAFEFLLILPFFVYFVLLLVDFGILMYGFVSVANAAREGARFGAVNCAISTGCNASDIQARTVTRSGGFLTANGQVAVDWDGTFRGNTVRVQGTRSHGLLFFPATVPVTSCVEMRLERDESTPTGGTNFTC